MKLISLFCTECRSKGKPGKALQVMVTDDDLAVRCFNCHKLVLRFDSPNPILKELKEKVRRENEPPIIVDCPACGGSCELLKSEKTSDTRTISLLRRKACGKTTKSVFDNTGKPPTDIERLIDIIPEDAYLKPPDGYLEKQNAKLKAAKQKQGV